MSLPRRRSSRLRGSYSSLSKAANNAQPDVSTSRRLSYLTERDENSNASGQPPSSAAVTFPTTPRTPITAGRIKPSSEEMHPGKAHSTSSPSFDFRFAHPIPALGPNAQRMMDEIREEALRIKAQLAAQREEETRNALLEDQKVSVGRKLAIPKGKVGRFSDIHLAEFKKMDSIAGHASAFRAQPDRFTVATNSLKRSQSKAKLGGREEASQGRNTSSGPQSLENTPAKRVRIAEHQHPVPIVHNNPYTPKISRSQSFMNSISTPTQASLARTASVKQRSKIPALSQSPSKHSMTAPRRFNKSVTMYNLSGEMRSNLIRDLPTSPSKFDRLKSILRRPVAGAPKSIDEMHTSSHMVNRSIKPDLDKELPSIPSTPTLDRAKSIRHVNVTPRSAIRNTTSQQNSPSPLKVGMPQMSTIVDLPDVCYPSLAATLSRGNVSQKIKYPTLAPIDLSPKVSMQLGVSSTPISVPSTFTFRSDQTIDFGVSPHGFGASPGQSSIRQVRSSIFPGIASNPGPLPDNNKENLGGHTAIRHGKSEKKRCRPDPEFGEIEGVEGSPAKKRKVPIANLEVLMQPRLQAEKMARKSRIPSPSKKGSLSLARLNMLARPKSRK